MANDSRTLKDKLIEITHTVLAIFIEESIILLKELWGVIDTFNERHELVDFSCFFEYLFVAFGIYFLGVTSKVFLVAGVLVLAHGERRAVRRQRKVTLRQGIEEADPQTLAWLGEYLQERAPIVPKDLKKDQFDLQEVGWLNELVHQAWPHAEPFFRTHLEQLVTMLQQYMQDKQIMGLTLNQIVDLRIETFRVGSKAPIIKGVRVVRRHDDSLRHGKDDHFVVEADIVYVSDAELVVCSKKFKAGIRELYVSGRMHFDLGPTITKMPLMAGLCLYMLEPPTIDFVTTSTASALDKLTREHISKVINNLLTKVITQLLVIPNNITVPFVDASSIRCPTPQGAVRVCVVEAQNVPLGDLLTKKDPYCIVTLGAEQSMTQCIKKTVSPCWVHWAQFVCTGKPGVGGPDLQFTIMDHDAVRSDTLICKMRLGTREVREKKFVDKWLHCSRTDCYLRVQALWLSFTDDEAQLPIQLAEIAAIQSASLCRKERKEGFSSLAEASSQASATNLFSCVLLVWLDSASGLPETSGNWRVQVEAGGDVQHSWAASQAVDGSWAWKQSFLFQLTNVHNNLNIKLKSHDGNVVKGKISLPVDHLLKMPLLTTGNQLHSITLTQGGCAKIQIDQSLKILSPAGKAMEDLKVINRKVREAEVPNPSTARELLRIGRNVSKSILPTKPGLTDGDMKGSPESQSTFYPETSGSSASGSGNAKDVQQPPWHFPHNLSPRLPRSRKSSNATIGSGSIGSSGFSSSLLNVPKQPNPNISDSDVKLRVRKRMFTHESSPSTFFANRRSISLENLVGETAPEKDGNLITKSLKRIRNPKMSRIHVRDIFASNMSGSSGISKSTLLIYGATTDPDQFSQLFKDTKS